MSKSTLPFLLTLFCLSLACGARKESSAANAAESLPDSLVRIQLTLTLPQEDSLESFRLLPLSGSLSEKMECLATEDLRSLRWDFPADEVPPPFALILEGRVDRYSARINPGELSGGSSLELDIQPVPLLHTAALPGMLTPLDRIQPDIPQGQYSGISHIGGHRYAVVCDKSPGSGIWIFSIPIKGERIGRVQAEQTAGSLSGGKSQDAEGIAYLPGQGTLLVSSEAQQRIREYNLRGEPSGRELPIPEDLGKDKIQPNCGFEALSLSGERIWTTTERALKADKGLFEGRDLVRIQSFSSESLQASERYFYLTDEAEISPEQARSALAYAFGIPALTALPDGRLLVLEREIYVPKGNVLEKAFKSFSRCKIYLVHPGTDPAGILSKTLLASFRTGALDLANFEGMCLGAKLPDGSQALVLIADSQGGKDQLVAENIKLLRLEL